MCYACKPLLERFVVNVLRPKIGIGGIHPVERENLAAARLVHYLDLYPYIFLFAVLDYAVSKFGVVRGAHFLDVEQHAAVSYDVVAEIVDVVDGAVVTYVAGVYGRVGDARREPQVVELQGAINHATNPHGPVEMIVLEHARRKLVCYPYGIPARSSVFVFDQTLDFVAGKMSPAALRLLGLSVPDVIFVLSLRQKFRSYPSVNELVRRQYGYLFHRCGKYPCYLVKIKGDRFSQSLTVTLKCRLFNSRISPGLQRCPEESFLRGPRALRLRRCLRSLPCRQIPSG